MRVTKLSLVILIALKPKIYDTIIKFYLDLGDRYKHLCLLRK